MSREQTPVLAGTLPAFEMFMSTWELLGEKHPRLEPFINIGLSWARKYYCRMDQTRAYIVAMGELLCILLLSVFRFIYVDFFVVLNPSVRLSWIRKHWEPPWIARAEGIIKGVVRQHTYIIFTLPYVLFTAG